MSGGNQFFKVKGKDGSWHYFDLKGVAKKFRDGPDAANKACVCPGPDHPNHHTNRGEVGWNKGKHPKKGLKGSKLFTAKK